MNWKFEFSLRGYFEAQVFQDRHLQAWAGMQVRSFGEHEHKWESQTCAAASGQRRESAWSSLPWHRCDVFCPHVQPHTTPGQLAFPIPFLHDGIASLPGRAARTREHGPHDRPLHREVARGRRLPALQFQ